MKARPNLDLLALEVHQLNAKWWFDIHTNEPLNRNKSEMQMLIISELAEAMEGERKDLMDDKLSHRKMAEVECADAVIRILDIMGKFNFKFTNAPVGDFTFNNIMEIDNRGEWLFNLCAIICNPMKFASMSDNFSCVILGIELYCKKFDYDLWAAVEEKLEYNKHREDHKAEVRAQAGGKKW